MNTQISLTDDTADRLMAKVLRDLSEQHGVSRQTIRAALENLSDQEFDALWSGERTVYVAEAMHITYAFEPDPTEWIYAKAIFDALDAQRDH
jgi:DNA-binding FadR family transcriptional regulator